MTHIRGLVTLLITAHEPPTVQDLEVLEFGLATEFVSRVTSHPNDTPRNPVTRHHITENPKLYNPINV